MSASTPKATLEQVNQTLVAAGLPSYTELVNMLALRVKGDNGTVRLTMGDIERSDALYRRTLVGLSNPRFSVLNTTLFRIADVTARRSACARERVRILAGMVARDGMDTLVSQLGLERATVADLQAQLEEAQATMKADRSAGTKHLVWN